MASKISTTSRKTRKLLNILDLMKNTKPTKEDLSNVGGKREFARALLQRNRKLIKKIESLRPGKVETPTTFEVFSRKMMKMMSQQLEMLNSLDRRMAVIEGDVGEIKRSIAVKKNDP